MPELDFNKVPEIPADLVTFTIETLTGKLHFLCSDQKTKCDDLCDLVPFIQFKKREKHSWRSVTFSKVDITFSNI